MDGDRTSGEGPASVAAWEGLLSLGPAKGNYKHSTPLLYPSPLSFGGLRKSQNPGLSLKVSVR